jgi:hypothetical protein
MSVLLSTQSNKFRPQAGDRVIMVDPPKYEQDDWPMPGRVFLVDRLTSEGRVKLVGYAGAWRRHRFRVVEP